MEKKVKGFAVFLDGDTFPSVGVVPQLGMSVPFQTDFSIKDFS